jgi:Terminase small subunit
MLSGPHRRFAEGIVAGLNATQAYRAAYPKSSAEAARRSASELLTKPDTKAEIEQLRAEAQKLPGSAVMTLAEKRITLAGIVRAEKPLFRGSLVKTSDRLKAIELDDKHSAGTAGTGDNAPVVVAIIGGTDA